MEPTQAKDPNPATEALTNLRFDYAWKWFSYHAAQRITMFNYFLLVTGILANAYVVLIKEGLFVIATVLAGVGTLTSVGFLCLDCRNKQLVELGEDVLEKLERDTIFSSEFIMKKNQESIQLGFLFRESEEAAKWNQNLMRWFKATIIKHKVWIRTVQAAIGICFLMATTVPTFLPNVIQTRSSTDIDQLQGQIKDLETFVKRALVSARDRPSPPRTQVEEKGQGEKAAH